MSKLLSKKISFSRAIFVTGINLPHYSYNVLLVLSPFGLGIKKIPKKIRISIDSKDNFIKMHKQYNLKKTNNMQKQYMFYGLYWNLLRNYFQDLTKIFYVDLEFRGMGYKGSVSTKPDVQKFTFNIGYTHPITYIVPKFLKIKNSKIKVLKVKNFFLLGTSRQKVKESVQFLKSLKRKDIYKGKGIFYLEEIVKLKQGKKQK